MQKLEFFEVNFGELQVHPLMTAKCFSSLSLASDYAKQIYDDLVKFNQKFNVTLVEHDYTFTSSDCVFTLVFVNKSDHLEIYEIKVIKHFYLLED